MTPNTPHANHARVSAEPAVPSLVELRGLHATATPLAMRLAVDFRLGPPPTSELATALYRLYDRTPPGASWVVDVSACDPVPLALCSLLSIFQAKLRDSGRDLRMVGANYDLLPSESFLG